MKPHPRIRKTIKWGGAVVTVLLVVVWVGSGWWRGDWVGVHSSWGFSGGAVYMAGHRPYPAEWLGLTVNARVRGSGWMLMPTTNLAGDNVDPKRYRNYILPLWIPTILTLAITYRAWHLDTLARRRAKLNLCSKCNYDRTGLAAGAVCPECGAGPVGGSVSAKS